MDLSEERTLPRPRSDDSAPSTNSSSPPDYVPIPKRLGRYEVVRELGRGTMGRVLLAYDPELDRQVAIKILIACGTEQTTRLRREAATLAELDHPNIVKVYDVGEQADRVYVVMEYVAGSTLRRWQRQSARSFDEILDVFAEAGHGLAAAHELGIVHRDFKPANVVLATDGRVRILDFGLALDVPATHALLESESGGSTASGSVAGTPAYMAPEQYDRGDIDARADQFAFCVALYEAMVGKRPYGPLGPIALAESKLEGDVRFPSKHGVPRQIRRALLRGLSADPADRWPNMERLLAELHPAPRTGRYALGAAVALAATAAWLGRSEDETSCTDRAELTGTWDDNRRKALEAALAVERSDHARSVGTAIERRLDVYANRWSAAYRVACDSKGEQLGASRAEAFGCLARARTQLATFVEGTLQGVESDRREEVARSALLLPEPATCLESTGSDVAPGPEHEKLAELLAEGRGYWLSGQSSMAEATARAVLATAESRGQKAIVADAALLAGQTALRDHRGEQAVPYLEQAYETALETRQDLIALRAAGALVHHYTNRAGNEELAERWLAAGKTLLRRDESLPADVLLAEAAFLRVRQGRYPEAISLYEEALTARRARNIDHDSSLATLLSEGAEAYRGNGDPDHALEYLRQARSIWAQIGGSKGLEVSRLDRRLAGVYKSKGEFERAIELYRRAASGTEASVGPEHNEIANIYNGLGGALAQTGRWDEAREAFERALPIYEKYDARQQAAIVLTNLGNVAGSQGHHDEAERYFIRSLEARRADVGTDHPDVALTLNNLGFLMMTTGRLDRAQAYHEEALAIRSKVLGSEHPDTANSLANLALVFEAQGRFDEALALQQRALEIRRARLGPSHRDTIGAILSMARNRGKAGDLETAARHVETALERCSPSCAAFEALAEVALTVAEKLYRAGKTPRASSLLRRIRQEIPEAPMPSWLRRQG